MSLAYTFIYYMVCYLFSQLFFMEGDINFPVKWLRRRGALSVERLSDSRDGYFGSFRAALELWRYVKGYDPRLERVPVGVQLN